MSLENARTSWVINASTEVFAKKSDFWNEERIINLRRMWDEGLSASQIGQELGCTRNAVIGKAFRLQLSSRKARSWPEGLERPPRGPRRPIVRVKMPNPAVGPSLPLQELPAPAPRPSHEPVAFMDLQGHHCRYPFDTEDGVQYCGAQKQDGLPYCAYHARLCYNAPTR